MNIRLVIDTWTCKSACYNRKWAMNEAELQSIFHVLYTVVFGVGSVDAISGKYCKRTTDEVGIPWKAVTHERVQTEMDSRKVKFSA